MALDHPILAGAEVEKPRRELNPPIKSRSGAAHKQSPSFRTQPTLLPHNSGFFHSLSHHHAQSSSRLLSLCRRQPFHRRRRPGTPVPNRQFHQPQGCTSRATAAFRPSPLRRRRNLNAPSCQCGGPWCVTRGAFEGYCESYEECEGARRRRESWLRISETPTVRRGCSS